MKKGIICDETTEKDVDRMKKLFSDYALEENKDLTGELEEFYKFFPEIKEVKNKSCASSRSDNIGTTDPVCICILKRMRS